MSTSPEPRAPAIQAKLDAAIAVLEGLQLEVGEYALAAAENRSGAAARLSAHRSKIDTAKTQVEELRAAMRLAAKLDRQASAADAARMRQEQFGVLKTRLTARQSGMEVVMKAAVMMAEGYWVYCNETQLAAAIVPSGTHAPPMFIGKNGLLGHAFGPGERLVLAELFRLAPERDGKRFVLPFAKPASLNEIEPEQVPPAIDMLKEADAAILADIEGQINRLNREAFAATNEISRKDAVA